MEFAVIGVGRMGFRHALNLRRALVPGARLAAVCDTDERVLAGLRRRFPGLPAYSNHVDMLDREDLDCAIIATPHYAHPGIAIACIERGVHTLVEKPLAVTAAEAAAVVEVARANPGVKAGVSYNQRSNRLYRRAKELVRSGELGKITRVNLIVTDWYRSQAYYDQGLWRASYRGEGGGVLINQCVHQLDILHWLIGPPRSVFAYQASVDRRISVENDVAALLDYGSFRCSFSASTHELGGVNRLEIAFDSGRVVIGPLSMTIYRHKSEERVNAETSSGYGFAACSRRRVGYGLARLAVDLALGQQLRSVRAFAAEAAGTGKMLAELPEGLGALELINAIYLSAWEKREMPVPVDPAAYESALEQRRREERCR